MKRLTLTAIFFLIFSTSIVAHAGQFDGLWLMQEFPDTLLSMRHDGTTILAVEMNMEGIRTWNAYFGTINGNQASAQSLISDINLDVNISFTSVSAGLMTVVSCFSLDPTDCPPAGAVVHLNKIY